LRGSIRRVNGGVNPVENRGKPYKTPHIGGKFKKIKGEDKTNTQAVFFPEV
jgi:hypothetical protein